MDLSKIKVAPFIKKNLTTIAFILIIPLGILVGYFFSNIKNAFAGGVGSLLTPVNKALYVAKVDGIGITKGEWEKALKSRYGQNAARELIDIYMVRNALNKAGIKVSEEEINSEIADIEKQLAGQNLEELLGQQGRTLADFRKDVYLQVGMKKLLNDKVVVTDQEVTDYVTAAGEALTGENEDEKKANAKKAVTDQKLGEEINKWYSELQTTAKIENYLEKK